MRDQGKGRKKKEHGEMSSKSLIKTFAMCRGKGGKKKKRQHSDNGGEGSQERKRGFLGSVSAMKGKGGEKRGNRVGEFLD